MSYEQVVMPSTSGTTNSQIYLDTKNNVILRPKTLEGISGFIFDIPDTDSLDLSSDITDHYTESNSFINDHIVRKPIMITLTGFIGELVYRKQSGIAGAAQEISNRLTIVDGYLGELTPGALQTAQIAVQAAQRAISGINQTIDRTRNIVNFFTGEGPEETAQEKAYRVLKALWKSSEFVSVQTPWDYFDNMIVKGVSFRQNGDSKSITDISVTLKEFRVSETKTVDYDENQFPPREQIQSGEVEDQGIMQGSEEDVSGLYLGFVKE